MVHSQALPPEILCTYMYMHIHSALYIHSEFVENRYIHVCLVEMYACR